MGFLIEVVANAEGHTVRQALTMHGVAIERAATFEISHVEV